MRLADDLRRDIQVAKKWRLPWWGLLCLVISSLPIYWVFDHFGTLSVALPTLNCVAVLGFAIAVKWQLKRRVWFWGIIAILAASHVPLILFVPWTTAWVPAVAIALIDSADLIVILAILSLVERRLEMPRRSGQ